MSSFLRDFRTEWFRPNNIVPRLILVNVFVYVVLNLLYFTTTIFPTAFLFKKAARLLFIPTDFYDFLYTPWTIITYSFSHLDFMHIFSNMLFLYLFGMIVRDTLGNQKVLALYFYGAIAGGISYLFMYNLIDFFIAMKSPDGMGMLGASAGIYAIVVGAAVLLPDYKVHLFIIGDAKLKYIAIAVVFLSFLSTTGYNAGGNIAHLGGALLGAVFIKQLRKGNDFSKPLTKFFALLESLLAKKPKMKVVQTASAKSKSNTDEHLTANPNEELIDKILDKISESGYESLSKEEKQILFRASQKK